MLLDISVDLEHESFWKILNAEARNVLNTEKNKTSLLYSDSTNWKSIRND